MGACLCHVTAKGATIRDAYDNAVQEDYWENGHGGYTGGISGKGGYYEITVPAGLTFTELIEGLECLRYDDNGDLITTPPTEPRPAKSEHEVAWHQREFDTLTKLYALVPPLTLQTWHRVYEDKWGSILATKVDDGLYEFAGYASC